MKAEAL